MKSKILEITIPEKMDVQINRLVKKHGMAYTSKAHFVRCAIEGLVKAHKRALKPVHEGVDVYDNERSE